MSKANHLVKAKVTGYETLVGSKLFNWNFNLDSSDSLLSLSSSSAQSPSLRHSSPQDLSFCSHWGSTLFLPSSFSGPIRTIGPSQTSCTPFQLPVFSRPPQLFMSFPSPAPPSDTCLSHWLSGPPTSPRILPAGRYLCLGVKAMCVIAEPVVWSIKILSESLSEPVLLWSVFTTNLAF